MAVAAAAAASQTSGDCLVGLRWNWLAGEAFSCSGGAFFGGASVPTLLFGILGGAGTEKVGMKMCAVRVVAVVAALLVAGAVLEVCPLLAVLSSSLSNECRRMSSLSVSVSVRVSVFCVFFVVDVSFKKLKNDNWKKKCK